jgi:hypothetical protein
MLTRPVRLEAVAEKYSTKWHSIRGGYAALFDAQSVALVEKWYNSIAPLRHRNAFRAVMKGILKSSTAVRDSHASELEECKVANLIRVYGAPLSSHGKEGARVWLLLPSTSPSDVDNFRDVFTGVQSLYAQESHFKETFKYRPLPDIPSASAHRLKIDWSNSNAQAAVQRATSAPEATPRGDTGTGGPTSHGRKNTSKGNAAETDAKIAELKQKRQLHQQSDKYVVDPATGCSTFYATRGSPRQQSNSKQRVMATFQPTEASSWISTTRELIRNYGTRVLAVERVLPEHHPAIALTTASVGLCVPNDLRRNGAASKLVTSS